MIYVEFEYRDKFTSNGEWQKRSCTGDSLQEIIDWYGLCTDCEYRIIKKIEDYKE